MPTEAPQHVRSLALANRTRLHRRAVVGQVRNGETNLLALLSGPAYQDPMLARMPVVELLRGARRVGEETALKILAEAEIFNQQKTLGTLTVRQRRTLLAEVYDRPWMWESALVDERQVAA